MFKRHKSLFFNFIYLFKIPKRIAYWSYIGLFIKGLMKRKMKILWDIIFVHMYEIVKIQCIFNKLLDLFSFPMNELNELDLNDETILAKISHVLHLTSNFFIYETK